MKLRAVLVALVAAATAFSFVLAPASPASAEAGDAVLTGTVTDATTGTPLDSVCIVNGPVALRCWTITNSLGEYRVVIPGAPPNYQTNIQFFRTGYTPLSRDVTMNPDTTQTMNVTMQSQTPGAPPPSATPPPFIGNPPPSAPPPPNFTVYLPNITRMLGGRYGWHTPFIVQNVGTVQTTLTVNFYKFSDGSLVATRTAVVQPGRSFVDSPNDEADLPADTQFSVVITSVGAPVVATVNEHQGGPGITPEALSYSGLSSGATKVSLPLVSNLAGQWLTTMIMQNLGAATTTITGTFVRLDGTGSPVTITRIVQPGRSQFIDPRVESTLASGVEYAATFSAAEPFAVVANAHHDLPGTTAPMGDSFNGVPFSNLTTTWGPYVAKNTDGVGRNSRVIVQNAGTTAATPSITLTPFGGTSPTPVTGIPSIAPGASYSFTPTTADGEFSLRISGGTFAALVTTISPATAMFYTGTSVTGTKLYMPNLTRTLTLDPTTDPGWTTPILIQSSDATAATLKWFRFSDGSLVTTQPVTLTPGATLRVDPRTVTGLSDNTQYAVVLESTQQVLAIVTELNLSGGDNAMIYKAFLQP